MVLCISVVTPAANRDAFPLWHYSQGVQSFRYVLRFKFFTNRKTNALFFSGCSKSVLWWAAWLTLLCCSAATGIPLCQQLYALRNNFAPFSFLFDSLHASSGLRKLFVKYHHSYVTFLKSDIKTYMWCWSCAAVGSTIQLGYQTAIGWRLFSALTSMAAFSWQPSSAVYLYIWISTHLWICQSHFADSFLCIGNHCSQSLCVLPFSFSPAKVRLGHNLFFPSSLE